jgi:hypothetical protein
MRSSVNYYVRVPYSYSCMVIKIWDLFENLGRMVGMKIDKILKKVLVGNDVRVRPKRRFLDQIEPVLEKGQVKSTRNRRVCMKTLM